MSATIVPTSKTITTSFNTEALFKGCLARTKELGEINFYFCDDNELLESNTKYLNHEEYTDILTFDYSEKKLVSADIMISVDRIQENSSIFDQKFEDELHRVIIHGILHIIGYNDKTEEEKKLMRKKEDYYIKKV